MLRKNRSLSFTVRRGRHYTPSPTLFYFFVYYTRASIPRIRARLLRGSPGVSNPTGPGSFIGRIPGCSADSGSGGPLLRPSPCFCTSRVNVHCSVQGDNLSMNLCKSFLTLYSRSTPVYTLHVCPCQEAKVVDHSSIPQREFIVSNMSTPEPMTTTSSSITVTSSVSCTSNLTFCIFTMPARAPP